VLVLASFSTSCVSADFDLSMRLGCGSISCVGADFDFTLSTPNSYLRLATSIFVERKTWKTSTDLGDAALSAI
jgi:hypothetical protein